jgi:hypothetical protein
LPYRNPSIFKQGELRAMCLHFNGGIRTGYGADATADTMGWFMHLGTKVPFLIKFIRHRDYLHGAGMHAEFASLAIDFIYYDAGHVKFL